MIIFGMIGDLDHAFCSPYIFCTRSQRVAALVSQIQITVRRASLSKGEERYFFICLKIFVPIEKAYFSICLKIFVSIEKEYFLCLVGSRCGERLPVGFRLVTTGQIFLYLLENICLH